VYLHGKSEKNTRKEDKKKTQVNQTPKTQNRKRNRRAIAHNNLKNEKKKEKGRGGSYGKDRKKPKDNRKGEKKGGRRITLFWRKKNVKIHRCRKRGVRRSEEEKSLSGRGTGEGNVWSAPWVNRKKSKKDNQNGQSLITLLSWCTERVWIGQCEGGERAGSEG